MATAKKTPAKKPSATKSREETADSPSAAKGAAKRAARKTVAPSNPRVRAKRSADAEAAVDQQLARYQSMRDFSQTPEPRGTAKDSGKAFPFVVQKHDASHLHYDFRLGWRGVLKSWACVKGPSYYPGDRRLAVQVEDHPIEYGGFEGIIPKGQYGGGTVMLWDQGTWEPQPGHSDVEAGLRDGSLKFTLYGTKLKGNWALIRMGGKAAGERKPNWLLIKEHDSLERSKEAEPITEEAPDSVVTHRSIDQIAASKDSVWGSKKRDTDPKGDTERTRERGGFVPEAIKRTPEESLPSFIAPQLASQATVPPSTPGWIHELKLDGYRIQSRLQNGKVQLLTRTGLDWTHRMKSVAEEVARLPVRTTLLDGEVVVLGKDGNTSFASLQAAFQEGIKEPLLYFFFDLLHLNGHNLRGLPLVQRKGILAELLKDSGGDTLRFSEDLEGDAAKIFQHACALHAEGILCKRSDATYASGRSTSWLKLKCVHEQEFVVGGFTLPEKGHAGMHGVGSLLLGYYECDSDRGSKEEPLRLIYAGRTGTGFTQKTHLLLRTQLERLRQQANPFFDPPAEARQKAIWVSPSLVAQVRFANWTADNLLRQASFQGLREDKPAIEIRREDTLAEARSAERTANTRYIPVAAKIAKPIHLTHPNKILDTESNLTKQQLADYYQAIAPHLLPLIANRPLSLVRCPEGLSRPCFFQKHSTATLPAYIQSVNIPDKKTGKQESYISVSTSEALAELAQLGVLELHPWGCRNEDIEHPDQVIFDLDPDPAIPWSTLAEAASEVRNRLAQAGLQSYLKSTGGKGLHVVAPIQPENDWSTVKEFAHAFVLLLEEANPALYITTMSKFARRGKIYLDYLRNERGATAIAAYSPRARAGAPVALPLRWSDLRLADRPLFHVSDYASWKSRLPRDPWKGFDSVMQSLRALQTSSLTSASS